MLTRRILLAASFAAAASGGAAMAAQALRIGYQKSGMLTAVRQRGTLDAALKPAGVEVTWSEFPSGPPIMEALRAGAIDLGYAGDTPPIFAQAARGDFVYAAATPNGGSTAAILLPPGSKLQALAELKGKRVAFAKATSAHNLTVAALEKVGLAYGDIEPVYLAPADGAAAFLRGAVDAWTVWDPYYAIAESQPGVRVLARSEDVAAQNSFLLVTRAYVRDAPDVVGTTLRTLATEADWAGAHRDELAGILSQGTGVPVEPMRRMVARAHFGFTPMTDDVLRQQQAIADRFHRLGLIPAPVSIASAVWHQAA